ncbi:MAG TPA: YfiR family protein [Candidatus Acidoferrales bacterium]|nr:YfiR family protein [Candidatus Acidoferrales bacterium]
MLRFRCVCAICLALPIALFAAQRGRPTQYDVEAVYLYQFGKFVQWPTASVPTEPFSICVMGRDPFAQTLDNTIAGETIGQAPLKADRVDTIDDAKYCRILFISASEDARLEEILNRIGKAPVLTVSDVPGFIARGGMIQFVVQDNRVRFEINVATAKQAGLTMSSQLLKVAAAVRGAPAAGANQ